MSNKHLSHVAIGARLKRAEGHLKSVIGMLEAERACVDIAQQLHAVEAAISAAKRELIHDHIEHCLEDGGANDLTEIKKLTKYL